MISDVVKIEANGEEFTRPVCAYSALAIALRLKDADHDDPPAAPSQTLATLLPASARRSPSRLLRSGRRLSTRPSPRAAALKSKSMPRPRERVRLNPLLALIINWFRLTFARLPSAEITKFVSTTETKSERPDLGSAARVVSGGRALKNKETFGGIIEPLADVLGAGRFRLASVWYPPFISLRD